MASAMVKTSADERMWCSHCCVRSSVRFEGNSVKACSICGKILSDGSGTAEHCTRLFKLYFELKNERDPKDTVRKRKRKHSRRRRRRRSCSSEPPLSSQKL